MTDFPTTCAVVIFRVKVSCITSLFWWYYTLVIDLIGQLRRHVIGRLSVKLWCHWLWRLVKLLLKWLLGSNLSQLYLAACENSTINTFKTLQVSSCRWEVSVSKGKGMEWVHFNFPPPLLPTDATGPLLCWPIISNEVTEWKKYCFILNSTDCVINYCLLLTAITTKNIIHQIYIITIPTINLHYKNRGWIPAYSGMLVPAS